MSGGWWAITVIGGFLFAFIVYPSVWLIGYGRAWWGHNRKSLQKFLEAAERGRTGLET